MANIYLDNGQISELDAVSRVLKVSRSELIRQALKSYLSRLPENLGEQSQAKQQAISELLARGRERAERYGNKSLMYEFSFRDFQEAQKK